MAHDAEFAQILISFISSFLFAVSVSISVAAFKQKFGIQHEQEKIKRSSFTLTKKIKSEVTLTTDTKFEAIEILDEDDL